MYTWRNFRTVSNLRELENIRETTGYAIQSQYSASKKILALAAGYQERIDPHADVDLFYRKMFDICTAEGVGLDNWGVILQMGRTIADPDTGAAITPGDGHYRLLLLYRAMANISASTAGAQNSLLAALVNTGIAAFPRAAYVLEVDTMVIRWVFEDFPDPIQLAVFKAAGTLARGAGVGWELYAVNPDRVFGFEATSDRSSVATMLPEASSGNAPSSLDGSLRSRLPPASGFQPFNQAPFAPDDALVINR
jgi:hypothetical protein